MNKALLIKQLTAQLEAVYTAAVTAAQRAYDTATAEENKAENKYDTLGLEASYLAHGQSKRVAECEADVITFKKLKMIEFFADDIISLGALVCLEDEMGAEKCIFISPVSGGLKTKFDGKEITMITPSAPIGKALCSRVLGDDVEINVGVDKKTYQITAIY